MLEGLTRIDHAIHRSSTCFVYLQRLCPAPSFSTSFPHYPLSRFLAKLLWADFFQLDNYHVRVCVRKKCQAQELTSLLDHLPRARNPLEQDSASQGVVVELGRSTRRKLRTAKDPGSQSWELAKRNFLTSVNRSNLSWSAVGVLSSLFLGANKTKQPAGLRSLSPRL